MLDFGAVGPAPPYFLKILQFPGAEVRQSWVRNQLSQVPAMEAGEQLERILAVSESGHANAREAVFTIVQVIVAEPELPALEKLRVAAAAADWFHLQRLLHIGPQPVQQARPVHEQPVPDYGAGRELTLGERRSLARRPSRRAFEKLLSDPHPMVISLVLSNPRAVEDDVVQLATARPAPVELLREIARSHWISRARVRTCFLHNPGTPPELAVPLLYLCARQELVEVVRSPRVQPLVRRCAQELLDRRPPVPERVQHVDDVH